MIHAAMVAVTIMLGFSILVKIGAIIYLTLRIRDRRYREARADFDRLATKVRSRMS